MAGPRVVLVALDEPRDPDVWGPEAAPTRRLLVWLGCSWAEFSAWTVLLPLRSAPGRTDRERGDALWRSTAPEEGPWVALGAAAARALLAGPRWSRVERLTTRALRAEPRSIWHGPRLSEILAVQADDAERERFRNLLEAVRSRQRADYAKRGRL